MVVHELATNAVKYGALSVEAGKLDISSTADERDVCLIWAETGGPTLENSPELRGFGSKLLSRSVSQQLDGELNYDWQPTGLVLTLRMRKDRLAT
jgi:two-component sensor histidine kinase